VSVYNILVERKELIDLSRLCRIAPRAAVFRALFSEKFLNILNPSVGAPAALNDGRHKTESPKARNDDRQAQRAGVNPAPPDVACVSFSVTTEPGEDIFTEKIAKNGLSMSTHHVH
jgi:hypothetical protein